MKFCVLLFCIIGISDSVLLRTKCPRREIHVACAFNDESSCWQSEKRISRIATGPKRLMHCKSGCFCKKGYVRSFPGGDCMMATLCRDRRLVSVIVNLPTDFPELFD